MRKGYKRSKLARDPVEFIREMEKDLEEAPLAVHEAQEVLNLVVDFVKTGDRDNLEKAREKRNSASNRLRSVADKLLKHNPMELA